MNLHSDVMLLVEDNVDEEDSLSFSWGIMKGTGGPNKDIQFYESFTYDGVEYSLYDCVYLWRDNQIDIGKLLKIWETATHKKKVKVLWFFRPNEIRNWLGDVKPLKNEIFLASGKGIGLYNLIPLVIGSLCSPLEFVSFKHCQLSW